MLALDELHREPRQAVGRRSAVVETRDVRVLERREDPSLRVEAFEQEPRTALAADDLHGGAPLEAVAAMDAEVDGAHPAPPELAEDLVRPDPRGKRRGRGRRIRRIRAPEAARRVVNDGFEARPLGREIHRLGPAEELRRHGDPAISRWSQASA